MLTSLAFALSLYYGLELVPDLIHSSTLPATYSAAQDGVSPKSITV